jgi:hypothetical protein
MRLPSGLNAALSTRPDNVLTLRFEVTAMDENLAPEPQWQFNLIRQISVRKDDGQRRQEN